MSKQLLRLICFFLLAALMLFGLAELFKDRETTMYYFYEEPPESVSVIVVGGSHVNQGVIPARLWQDYSIAEDNIYSWNQAMWASYYYIEEVLRTQTPDVIVLDMYGMTYGSSYIMPQAIDSDTYNSALNFRTGLPLYKMMLSMRFVSIETPDLTEYSNLVRYHSRWKELFSDDYFYNPYSQSSFLRGYGYMIERETELSQPDHSDQTMPIEPYEYCMTFLDKTVELAEKKNINLVFTMLPYVYNDREQGIFLWLEDYAEEHDIPFINYNGADGERIGIDLTTDFCDQGHLNYWGAMKTTADIGEFLRKNYNLPQKNDIPNWEQRDYDSLLFNRTEKVNELMLEESLSVYIDKVFSDNNLSFTLAINNSQSLDEQTRQILSSYIGELSSKPFVVIKNNSKFLICENAGEQAMGDYTINYDLESFGFLLSINGEELTTPDNSFGIFLYDEVLRKPVEFAFFNGDFVHNEFTSLYLENLKQCNSIK